MYSEIVIIVSAANLGARKSSSSACVDALSCTQMQIGLHASLRIFQRAYLLMKALFVSLNVTHFAFDAHAIYVKDTVSLLGFRLNYLCIFHRRQWPETDSWQKLTFLNEWQGKQAITIWKTAATGSFCSYLALRRVNMNMHRYEIRSHQDLWFNIYQSHYLHYLYSN